MARESREWSVPAPVRALLWWPATSFVLVVIAPEAAVSSIVAAGALLAVIGAFLSAAASRLHQSRIQERAGAAPATIAETMDLPTVVIAPIEDPAQRRVA